MEGSNWHGLDYVGVRTSIGGFEKQFGMQAWPCPL